MRKSLIPSLVLAVAVVSYGCHDLPSSPAGEEEATFAKGGKGKGGGGADLPDAVSLGRLLFEDETLSLHENQSCQTCHHPDEGFAASVDATFATQGSVVQGSKLLEGSFGDRKPPSAAYATFAPTFGTSGNSALGGTFWDGRATGDVTGNPAADQALGPFLNPVEQALPSSACLVHKVCTGSYGDAFVAVWGNDACPALPVDVCDQPLDPALETAVMESYHAIGLSIAAFEASADVSAFSSRFDGGAMTSLEQEGEKLFGSKGKCGQCHDAKGSRPLYTDFQYHNLGVPRNPENPSYGEAGFDPGLGGFTGSAPHFGKFKTPTVRNVAEGTHRTYMHNGALKSLRQVVQFYNTRDVLPTCGPGQDDPGLWGPDGYGCWPVPEYAENMDTKQMGDLGLTSGEVDAIVAFMEALTDG
jgi:cytochrome c peroxidase